MNLRGLAVLVVATVLRVSIHAQGTKPADLPKLPTWTSDNGNGTFTNPLFYDEFSDPDMIRVGDDYYLTGTTMHTMPGLPVLHSKDLVNWDFVSYAVDKLDLGPKFRLDSGNVYGRGIWAPCFCYYKGKYYIFSNVNGKTTQLFTAGSPKGPWKQSAMKKSLHDLSVLFDDDGKVYVVYAYDEVHLAELTDDLMDIKPGTDQIIVPRGSGAGEGSHFYKINGKYYITSANWDPICYEACLRADKVRGPYEVNVMSVNEGFGIGTGWHLANEKAEAPFKLLPPVPNLVGRIPMHQGGIVQVQSGEWWGWSMMDHNSVGRLTCLSPVTWQNGWPYFGLPGNLTRSPGTWVKPNTGFTSIPHAPYQRSDDFSATTLTPVWQWNHVPVDTKWSLKARPGYLRLNSLPAADYWTAKNSLTQRAIGPESTVTTEVDVSGLKEGDIAGLALLNMPYAWLGVAKSVSGLQLRQYDLQRQNNANLPFKGRSIWLRAHCNFDTEMAEFSYSADGMHFKNIGEQFIMIYSGRSFQGVRYSLFNFNTLGAAGGYADFNSLVVDEQRPHGLTQAIPYGKTISLRSLADSTILVNWKNFVRPVRANDPAAKGDAGKFEVVDAGNGRIALRSVASGGWVTVKGLGVTAEVRIEKELSGDSSVFQWQDMQRGDLMLMSLQTHRYLFATPNGRDLCSADAPGTRPDRKDGACFSWSIEL